MKVPFEQFGDRTWGALVQHWPILATFVRPEDGPRIIQGSLEAYFQDKGQIPSMPNHKGIPPTPDQVAAYFREIEYKANSEEFMAYYDANGWMVGRVKMKSWQAAARLWKSRDKGNRQPFQRKASFA